jgi:hypothetical protein
MPRSRTRTAALVTAGVLALGGAATAVTLASADPSTSPTPSGAPSGAPSVTPGGPDGGPRGDHGRGGPGRPDDQLAGQLAGKLGLSEAKVTAALDAARSELKPGTPPSTPPSPGTRPDPSAHEAALAKVLAGKLGVDEAKVTAALAEIRAAREADRTAAFTTKIARAVTDGQLTRAEADAVLKAQKLGLVGGR